MKNKEITNNPFSSELFESIWVKHFKSNNQPISFESIEGVKFTRHSNLSLYSNVGRTNTKGVSYQVIKSASGSLNKKVILFYDVPDYFGMEIPNLPKNIVLNKVQQYPGFLINLDKYNSLNDYMAGFSKRTRYKLNKSRKRLNISFSINYKVFFGEITDKEYDYLFTCFRELLEKRFEQKAITNNNLETTEWNFYKEVALPMIRNEQAALSVIFDGENPIAITLNFIGDDILFDAITVFDIDYQKFNLGYVHIIYLIEWCLKSNIKVLDFSKGYFDYKTIWSNLQYSFYYHIIHDSKHIPSCLTAFILKSYFKLKQRLRDYNLNALLHKMTFLLNSKKEKNRYKGQYTLKIVDEIENFNILKKIEKSSLEFAKIKREVISFLFLHEESMSTIEMYYNPEVDNYFIIGKKKIVKLVKQ